VACSLLCFGAPLGTARHQARHNLGWAPDRRLRERIAAHLAGQGAAITRYAVARGITLTVARVWPGETRVDDSRHKTGAHPGRLCPSCRAAKRSSSGR
jgi:hypothetical protein